VDVLLTTHIQLAPRLRISRDINVLFLGAFMARKGTNLTATSHTEIRIPILMYFPFAESRVSSRNAGGGKRLASTPLFVHTLVFKSQFVRVKFRGSPSLLVDDSIVGLC
jgi:hypothetical protein